MLNLKKVLQSIGIEPSDELIEKLTKADAEDAETVQEILSKAQAYAKPFLESEFNEKLSEERKAMKGKYFKELVQKVNKKFGSVLTSGDIDKILSNPENEGRTYDAVIDAIYEKSSGQGDIAELKRMLDAANTEKNTLKEQLDAKDTEYEQKLKQQIGQIETDRALDSELGKLVGNITSLNPQTALKLIRSELSGRAIVRLGADGKLNLYDPKNPEAQLKKSGTELYKIEDLVSDIAKENDLPAKKSAGTERVNTQLQQQETKLLPKAAAAAASLAEVMAGVSA